ncbi:MAG: hypothetical protein Q3979_07925 [Actinomycetaceae bacterium]|nr:hypothetical protein [Actinomycetaceae bacterium]
MTGRLDIGMLVAEVATRLRAGATPQRAWQQTLARAGLRTEIGPDGVPLALRDMWHAPRWRTRPGAGTLPGAGARSGLGAEVRPGTTARPGATVRLGEEVRLGIPPAVAVCKMSQHTGAPMADVLDSCAAGITEAGEAAAARRVALAGPRASARVLAWLPLVGLAFGTLLGADPLEFLLSQPAGRACLALGVGFEAAGVAWVRRLVRRAERQV